MIAGLVLASAENNKDPFIKGQSGALSMDAETITISLNKLGVPVSVEHQPEKNIRIVKMARYIIVRDDKGKEISRVTLRPGKMDKGILIQLSKDGKLVSSSEKHLNTPNKLYFLLKEFNDMEFYPDAQFGNKIKVLGKSNGGILLKEFN